MDEVHSAILLKKLNYIEEWIDRRREIAKRYDDEISDILDLTKEAPHNKHAYYIYVVAHNDRDKILEKLTERDIHLNISYPWPVHTMIGYEYLGWKDGDLPVTEKRANEIFSLPMYPTLTDDEQTEVINSLKDIIGGDGE